jgi:uncharacterized repeat protein (TIGR01451 family)
MSKRVFFRWVVLVVGLALLLVLSLQGMSVRAAQPDLPSMGITPTPTFTPLPPPTAVPPAEPDVEPVDPVITKRGEPREALPAEEVVFTIGVTNRGQRAAVDVVVTDEVVEYLEIVEVTTTQGTVLVEGQLVTVEVGVVGPGFVVEIVIRTRVRPDAPAPLDLENIALLRSPNGGDRTSPPVIISIPGTTRLPETGQMTAAWTISVRLLFGLVAIAGGLARRQRT